MNNKLFNENCLNTMRKMPDNYIDLTVTSPPYDDLRKYTGYTFDFESTARELYRVTKNGGVVVWIIGDKTINGSESGTSFNQALYFKDVGFNLHDTMIWYKTNPMPHIKQTLYTPSFEYMFVLSKGKPTTTNLLRVPTKYAGKILKTYTSNPESIRKPNKDKPTKATRIKHNVWNYTLAGTNYGHPAIFPLQLAKDHVTSWSNENDLVYDPFMGSGTTAVACIQLNRRYIGSEISKEYCEIAEKRMSEEKHGRN